MPPSPVFSKWHVSVAAEAIAAAQFARCGLDVSVQYGANQPEYDLMVSRGDNILKVSVKGSQNGRWGLAQSYLEKGRAGYHEAADKWLRRHHARTVLCFVQFTNVPLTELPRVYLATPAEVAQQLKEAARGRGGTILREYHRWGKKAFGAGTEERIPVHWRFSEARVNQLLAEA